MGNCSNLFNDISRLVLFVCNFVIFLTGCGILGFGIYLKTKLDDIPAAEGSRTMSASVLLITIGGMVTFVSFLGCCGSSSAKHHKLLYVYGSFLLIIFILEITVGGLGIYYREHAKNTTVEKLSATLENYGQTPQYDNLWDKLQRRFRCCGIGNLKSGNDGYLSWKKSYWFKDTCQLCPNRSISVPDSCCKINRPDCGIGQMSTPNNIYKIGCLDKLYVWVMTHMKIAITIGFLFCAFQLISLTAAFYLGMCIIHKTC